MHSAGQCMPSVYLAPYPFRKAQAVPIPLEGLIYSFSWYSESHDRARLDPAPRAPQEIEEPKILGRSLPFQ